MISKKIQNLKRILKDLKLDGYVVPKNDEFFSEYSRRNWLKKISNFSGSAGYAVILKKKNYLFVDSRYTIQAEIESGKNFRIVDYKKIFDCKLFKNLTLGINPQFFTSNQIEKFFLKNNNIKLITSKLIENIFNDKSSKNKPFFTIDKKIAGKGHIEKIKKVVNIIKRMRANYFFISAPENVAWLLNIRGYDNPNSPIPNCRLIINDKKKFFLISEISKARQLIYQNRINKDQIISPNEFEHFLNKQKNGKIIIDGKSCSVFYENLIKKNFSIIKKEDPIYFLKSIKNKTEISHMINAHILDGIALTKFLFWIKKVNKKMITEYDAQNKLENFRRKSKDYLFPSFDTIAGAGKNAAIVHYRADKHNSKKIKKNDIFLCDSGGQYKFGTTDVTRTICFKNQNLRLKNIFTKVLKGHIAVLKTNLEKNFNGNMIDIRARKYLKKSGLDYGHGTGHGVGFFLNVHEGPQAISKFNYVRIQEGMVLSNEPGYYEKNKFGVRIENLIYVKKEKKKIFFQNLTLAPIDKDLINFKLLNEVEKNYLFKYNLEIYSKLSSYLNKKEKKWLANLI